MTISTWYIPVNKIRDFNRLTNDFKIEIVTSAVPTDMFKDKLMVKLRCQENNWLEFNDEWQKAIDPKRYGLATKLTFKEKLLSLLSL
jgi:hypothetical protein